MKRSQGLRSPLGLGPRLLIGCALLAGSGGLVSCSGGGGSAPVGPAPAPAPPEPTLVADLNPETGGGGSNPRDGIELNGLLYFFGTTPETGFELFRTDGSIAGTELVFDVRPGSDVGFPEGLTVAGSLIFFLADDGRGKELWVTDGQASGTRLVREIVPGPGSTSIDIVGALGDELFFAVDDPARGIGKELYASDGQTIRLVADINSGPGGSSPGAGVEYDGRLVFSALASDTGRELWATDGSAAGTVLVTDIDPGARSSNPFPIGAAHGAFYFRARPAALGDELYRLDATGLALVVDLNPGPEDASPRYVGVHDSNLFFAATDGVHGHELFRYDGSSAAPVLVADLLPGPDGSGPRGLIELDTGVVFSADDGVRGHEPWIAAGPGFVPQLLVDAEPGPGSSARFVQGHRLTGTQGLLRLRTEALGSELWITDGTPAGTALFADIDPRVDRNGAGRHGLQAFVGSLESAAVISANNGVDGFEPWLVTTLGLQALDLVPLATRPSVPLRLIAANERVFFDAEHPELGRELWVSDGTAAGTTVIDISPGAGSALIRDGATLGDRVVFAARDGTTGHEPFVSDGTAAGTRLLRDIELGAVSSNPGSFRQLGDRVLFAVSSPADELWATDGTTAGTRRLRGFDNGPQLRRGVEFQGRLYFAANGGAGIGFELFVTDGTAPNTELFLDTVPGSTNGFPEPLGVVRDRLLFSARNAAGDLHVFATDGTAAGTAVVTTTPVGFSLSTLGQAAEFVLFTVSVAGGAELWRSDGTAAGTGPVATGVSGVPGAVAIGSELWFAAREDATGTELWRSDGSAAGTRLALDIHPGFRDSFPDGLVTDGSRGFFHAFRPEDGRELWRIDSDGGLTVVDIAPGRASSMFRGTDPVIVGGNLLLPADAGPTGLELFRLELQ
ncbi:MAG: hypothetical protein NXI31_01325 [bacterium]|nr:hypothetical protein [bacterium]